VLGDEPKDTNVLCLSNTISLIRSLEICLWILWREGIGAGPTVHLLDYIPITVVEYDDIRSRQIDAQASSASCEQEDELLIANQSC
jgi:hypothetical protein